MKSYQPKFSIAHWAEDDQPREKMLQKGKSTLSDAELLAILLRSGTSKQSAVELARIILKKASGDLNALAKWTPDDFKQFPGMGNAKATSIVAAFELGRRRKNKIQQNSRLISSKMVHLSVKDLFYDLSHEEFWILILNRNNEVISRKRISQGGVSGTVADGKLIFKYTLEQLGSSIILLHNHPSGNMSPSKADENLTQKLKSAAENLDIQLLDHLIVHNDRYFSFADEGLL